MGQQNNKSDIYLSTKDLATRWCGKIATKTIVNWQQSDPARRKGPPHMHIGGRILYRLADIEEWENSRRAA